jgi:hypothetical protein
MYLYEFLTSYDELEGYVMQGNSPAEIYHLRFFSAINYQ